MNLSDILMGKSGPTFDAPSKSVKFKVIGRDPQGSQTVADAEAALVFVTEDERTEARVAAELEVRKRGTADPEVLYDTRVYRLLTYALRDSEDHRKPFVSDVNLLQRSLNRRTVMELFSAYEQFVADEFPAQMDEELFEKLVESAKGKYLSDLLSSHDSWTILRAMPALVAHFGQLQTETSGSGEPT